MQKIGVHIFNYAKSIIYKIKRKIVLLQWENEFNQIYKNAIKSKQCYYGPFLGEFGHLLGHNLPFIAHLHSKGVQVQFCGLQIHKPFFYNEHKQLIVNNYLEVRDFFNESLPDCNTAQMPIDVQNTTNEFEVKAKLSKKLYFNNTNSDYYFNFFRWCIAKKNLVKIYDLSKIYQTKKENSVVIFPRKWNTVFSAAQLKNNGQIWNYKEVALLASMHFDKVYILGHPIFAQVDFESFNNIEVLLTADNGLILEKCSNSKLIISQHSGSVYLGEYTNTQMLIIYKGGIEIGDIEITKYFKKTLGNKFDFNYAFSYEEIEDYLINFQKLNNKNETIRN